MTCNGFGHPPWCDCGWGGKFYEPLPVGLASTAWRSEKSHTYPNAKCPVCGSDVFFYRSPEGGSVYFDELGPPWPKHRCTDQGASVRKGTEACKQKPGWWPFLLDQIFTLPASEGVCLIDLQERMVLVKTKARNFRIDTPVWLASQAGCKGEYRVSTLRTKGGRTFEVAFNGINFDLLCKLEYAKDFPETVAAVNERLRNASGTS